MYDSLDAKIAEYRSLGIEDPRLKNWIRESSLWYWLYGTLRIRGAGIGKEQILSILDGQLSEDLPLDLYSFVLGYASMYADMQLSGQMEPDPDIRLLARWGTMLGHELSMRDTNPVLYHWGFVPCHFREVTNELRRVMREYSAGAGKRHFIDRAAALHLGVIKVYPFKEETLDMAGALLLYSFICAGLPAPDLGVSREEYDKLVKRYTADGDASAFCGMLADSLSKRLDQVISVCRRAAET